jgi:ethanolamine ammonia-lyase small subunit
MALHDVLEFQLAHARARDAVHTGLDVDAVVALVPGAIAVRSAADNREIYLRRPDLGRQLHPDCVDLLQEGDYDVAFVIADGLSATAVMRNAVPMLNATLARLPGLKIAPVVVATQARVAIGDDIGAALGAKLVVMLIGERPGLTVAESLGIYLTFSPMRGVKDSARNCISNIHTKGGLSYDAAGDLLSWLIGESLRRGISGVGLKDASGLAAPEIAALIG